MKKLYAIRLGLAMFVMCATATAQAPNRSADRIPDEATAIKVAEAKLSPIYGKDHIRREEPFHATLDHEVWIVSGSLPQGWDGGVATIRLNKKTGRIISYIHGK
jgi:hypothetical protein